MMFSRIKFLPACLMVLLGIGLSYSVVWGIGLMKTPATPSWPLEGRKAGQASIVGRYPDSEFGRTIAIGDVNGDGFDDLIAGAPNVSEIVQSGGEVYVIPGPLAFNQVYTLPQSIALVFQGTSGYQPQIGSYLDSGDMNGDGFDDIVIGSWISDQTYVYLGSENIRASSPFTVAVSPSNMALTISPTSDGLVLCDFNSDGYKDLFVEETSFEQGIQVWGVLGSAALTMTHPQTLTMPSDADIVIKGAHPTGWFSPNQKNMACGDVDGDGYSDLVLGVYGASPQSKNGAGTVYVIRGRGGLTPGSPVTITLPDQAGAIIDGQDGRPGSSGDHLGQSLAVADVNRDGRADLIIGAPGASGPDNLFQYAGEVYLWLGRALEGQHFTVSAQASWTVYGEKGSDGLGQAIATGDFDNDSEPEILLGCASCASGEVPFYLYGRGYVLEPRQITGTVTVTAVSQFDVIPCKDGRGLGYAVNAMDLDGDGVRDLVMSAPWMDYLEGDLPGMVYVVSYPIHFRIFMPFIRK